MMDNLKKSFISAAGVFIAILIIFGGAFGAKASETIQVISPNGGEQDDPDNNFNTASANLELKSLFLKNDSRAILIFNGQNYILDSNKYLLVTGDIITGTFEYKIINSLKQLGYSEVLGLSNAPNNGLNYFQKKHNLPKSDILDKSTILLLDDELYKVELEDIKKANNYPPYQKFIAGPENEPSKEHLARLYYDFFNSLPSSSKAYFWYSENSLQNQIKEVINTVMSLDSFMVFQGHFQRGDYFGHFLDENSLSVLSTDDVITRRNNRNYSFKICADDYYAQVDYFNRCKFSRKVYNGGIVSDIAYVATLAHEYGHKIGEYIPSQDDVFFSRQDIQFGQISFDFSQNPQNSSIFVRQNNDGEFMSQYAKSNNFEDFAESFESYVLIGKIFRERAKSNIYLQQKYDFMKNKVFGGQEYNTGSLESYNLWISAKGASLPNKPTYYMREDLNWVWDYKYSLLSNAILSIPTPLSSPSPLPTPTSCIIPDGTLVKLPNDPKIYVIRDCKKVWIQTVEEFNRDGYKWSDVNELPSSTVNSIPSTSSVSSPNSALNPTVSPSASPAANIPEGAIIQVIGDPDVYIVKYMGNKKFKRLILSPSVFRSYGHLKWENIIKVDKATLDSFITSNLVRSENGKIYRLNPSGDNGIRNHIKDMNAFQRLSFDMDSVYQINTTDESSYRQGQELE